MIPLIVFAGIMIAGTLFLVFGPQSWRSMIMHGAVVALTGLGEVLNLLGAFDWRQVLDPETAAIVILALSILGVIYRLATHGPVGSKAAG